MKYLSLLKSARYRLDRAGLNKIKGQKNRALAVLLLLRVSRVMHNA